MKKINWKRGFARIAGIASILIVVVVGIWMFVDPERLPVKYFDVYEFLTEPVPDVWGGTMVYTDIRWLSWLRKNELSPSDVKLVERVPRNLEDLLALKDRYPQPDYKIREVTNYTRGKIDIWATAVRALLALIPWGFYLLVWVLILFLRACYRFVARGFKGS